tara:strand:+ start:78 stop:689 length:612 start_codon:yes stop_codon:yes gene_type:complete
MIGLINYGSGNFKSVSNILKFLDINFKEIKFEKDFKDVSHLILPGVGSFLSLVEILKKKNLFEIIRYNIFEKKIFYLGICVGMQILGDYGTELKKTDGFSLIDGSVEKIKTSKFLLPNIGWHKVNLKDKNNDLFKGIKPEEMFFYFVHSYSFLAKNRANITSTIFYENEVVASIKKENIYGVQFHPEKSQNSGCKLLKNFCNL